MASAEDENVVSTVMSRNQAGRSREQPVKFTGSPETGSTELSRHGRSRASSRSVEQTVNFTGSPETGSMPLRPPSPGADSCLTKDSVFTPDDKESFGSMMLKDHPEVTRGSSSRVSSRSWESDFKIKKSKPAGMFSRSRSLRSMMSNESSINSVREEVEDLRILDRPDSPTAQFQREPSERSSAFTSNSQESGRDSGIAGSSDLILFSIRSGEGLSKVPLLPAGPDDVPCDFCTGSKSKAFKSCLICLRSFCSRHVMDHYKYKELEEHQLVEATTDLDLYHELSELKQAIRILTEENRTLKELLKSSEKSSGPKLPAYICKGTIPTAANVVLDPETAHRALVISTDGKRVRMGQKSKVKAGPQRFDRWECVLAKDGFRSGRHYWQVEVNKEFTVGVMKSSAKRNSRFAFAPFQGYWCIFHFWLSFSALEDHVVRLPLNTVPQVLGVCVDMDEKWVTFYNTETQEQIYTFKNMKLAPEDKVYPIFRTVEKTMDLRISVF